MIAPVLDEISTGAGDRYVSFLLSLRGVLGVALKTRPDDMRAFGEIRTGAYAVAEVYLASEVDHFADALQRVQKAAVDAVRAEVLSDDPVTDIELEDYADELLTWFRLELRAQIERDVNVIVSKRRELVLAATTASWSRRRDLNTAYLQLQSARRESVDFYFTDRTGRRYPSQKYVRQLVRHALLNFACESFVLEAASFGVDTVFVDHPDRNNSHNGEAISLVGAANMLSLSDIRDEAFHPNSNAFLTTQ